MGRAAGRSVAVTVAAVLLAVGCGSSDASFLTQSETEQGAIDAAISLQKAALDVDLDGLKRGMSAECLDQIDEHDVRSALVFMRLFTQDLDLDGLRLDGSIESFGDGQASVEVAYLGEDGEPFDSGDDFFSLSEDTVDLVYEDGRWVVDGCDFSGDGSDTTSSCLDDGGAMGDCPEPTSSDRDDPVPIGEAAYVGDGWVMRVAGVDHDAAATIEAASGFDSSLEPGQQAVLVDLELAYIGADDPTQGFSVTIGGVGATGVSIDTFGCGFLPDDLDRSTDVFTGGVLRGQQCLPTPTDEVDSVVLYAEMWGSDQVFFDLHGTPADASLSSVSGPVAGADTHDARRSPAPAGTPVAAGDWTVQITSVDLDGEATVLAGSDFNDPAPDGSVYVLVTVQADFTGDEPQSVSGAIPGLVGPANVGIDATCSATFDGELDRFTDVFPGGTISGTLCYVVPEPELEDLVAYIRPDPFDDEIHFLSLD